VLPIVNLAFTSVRLVIQESFDHIHVTISSGVVERCRIKVYFRVCVGPLLQQQPHNFGMAVGSRIMQGRLVVLIADIRVGTVLEQQSHHVFVPVARRCMQRGVSEGDDSAKNDLCELEIR
jgi:hypothetical protein